MQIYKLLVYNTLNVLFPLLAFIVLGASKHEKMISYVILLVFGMHYYLFVYWYSVYYH